MLFVVIAMDKPGTNALRMATREKHLAYMRETACARLGGPFLDGNGNMIGSLVIIEADDLAAAKAWAAKDPYAVAGLFQSSETRPWKATVNPIGAAL